jgi:hypothetical protein
MLGFILLPYRCSQCGLRRYFLRGVIADQTDASG